MSIWKKKFIIYKFHVIYLFILLLNFKLISVFRVGKCALELFKLFIWVKSLMNAITCVRVHVCDWQIIIIDIDMGSSFKCLNFISAEVGGVYGMLVPHMDKIPLHIILLKSVQRVESLPFFSFAIYFIFFYFINKNMFDESSRFFFFWNFSF